MADRTCDLCGDRPASQWVGAADDPTGNRFFRHAAVCSLCMDERVLPSLRWLFGDGGHNLNAAPDDPEEAATHLNAGGGGVYMTFRADAGSKEHVVAEAKSGPPFGGRTFCVAHCGVSGFAEPATRSLPLSERGGGETCERCAAAAPDAVAGGDP